jgi:hypothetical protein
MKRIVIIATLVIFAQIAAGFSMPAPQTFPGAATLRRVEVNTKTITALTPGNNYIVDLTQRGVVYEFNHQAGAIDFSRVKVRTAKGEEAIGSYVETTFLKDKLAGFKYKSQAFSIATRPPGTVKNPPTGTSNFGCNGGLCGCKGASDCSDLLFNTSLCGGAIFCSKNSAGEPVCLCIRTA